MLNSRVVFERNVVVKTYINVSRNLDKFLASFNKENSLIISENKEHQNSISLNDFLENLKKEELKNVRIEDDLILLVKSYDEIAKIAFNRIKDFKFLTGQELIVAKLIHNSILKAYFYGEKNDKKFKNVNLSNEFFLSVKREVASVYKKFLKITPSKVYYKYQEFLKGVLCSKNYQEICLLFDNFMFASGGKSKNIHEINTALKHIKNRWCMFKGLDLKKENIQWERVYKATCLMYEDFVRTRNEINKKGEYSYSEFLKKCTRKLENKDSIYNKDRIIFISSKISEIELDFLKTFKPKEIVLIIDSSLKKTFKFGENILQNKKITSSLYIIKDNGVEKFETVKIRKDINLHALKKEDLEDKKVGIFFDSEVSLRHIEFELENLNINFKKEFTFKDSKILHELKKIVLLNLPKVQAMKLSGLNDNVFKILNLQNNERINLILRENKDFISKFDEIVESSTLVKDILKNKNEQKVFSYIKHILTKSTFSEIDLYFLLFSLKELGSIEEFNENAVYLCSYIENPNFFNLDSAYFIDFNAIYDFKEAEKYDYLPGKGFFVELTTIINSRANPFYLEARDQFRPLYQMQRKIRNSTIYYQISQSFLTYYIKRKKNIFEE